MSWINKKIKISAHLAAQKKKQQQFLWLFAALFIGVFGYGVWDDNLNYIPAIIGGGLLLLSFVFPKLIQPVLLGWMLLGMLLSELFSPIVLGLIYFIGIVPSRLFVKKNPGNGWVKTDEKTNFDQQF